MTSLRRSELAYRRIPTSSQNIYASVAKNSFFLIVLTVLSHVCILAQTIILTRALGPERYGVYAFAITLQSYLFLFSCVGVRPVVVREASQNPDDLDQILTSHLVFTAFFAVLLSILVLGATTFAAISSSERVLLGLMAIGNIPASINLLPLFDAHHRQLRSAVITLASEAAALLLLTYLYYSGRTDLDIVGAVLVGKWTANSALHCLYYYCRMRPIVLIFDADYLRRMAHSSWPLMIAALVATTPFSAGVFFVRLVRDDAGAAVIGLGQQATSAYLLLTAAGIRIAQPYLAGSQVGAEKFFKRLAILYSFFAGLLLLAFICGAFIVVRWLLDDRYQEALTPMILLLAAAFVQSLGAFASAKLIIQHDEIPILAAHGGAALFYLLACKWAVLHAGITGAVLLSGCASATASMILTARLFQRSAGLFRLSLRYPFLGRG